MAEYGPTGQVVRRYARGAGVDEPLVWYEGASNTDRRWLSADERGSVIAVTNGLGQPMAFNTYDEYGIPGSGNLGRFQYTGQAWLSSFGLYHYKARAYSPTLGRFMQTDPIGYGDGLNLYAYVHNDPINEWDPTGTVLVYAGANCVYLGGGLAGDAPLFGSTPRCTPQFVDVPDILGGIGGVARAVVGGLLGGPAAAATPKVKPPNVTCPKGTHYSPPQTQFPTRGAPCRGGEVCNAELPDQPQGGYGFKPLFNFGGLGYSNGNSPEKYFRYNCNGRDGRTCSFVAPNNDLPLGVIMKGTVHGLLPYDAQSFPLNIRTTPNGGSPNFTSAAQSNNQCVPDSR